LASVPRQLNNAERRFSYSLPMVLLPCSVTTLSAGQAALDTQRGGQPRNGIGTFLFPTGMPASRAGSGTHPRSVGSPAGSRGVYRFAPPGSMDRDRGTTAIRVAYDMVASANAGHFKAGLLQGTNNTQTRQDRERRHQATSSTSTASKSDRTSHSGMPPSASNEAKIASAAAMSSSGPVNPRRPLMTSLRRVGQAESPCESMAPAAGWKEGTLPGHGRSRRRPSPSLNTPDQGTPFRTV
jgi:hypothetical protein